jgi:hypothetical protein
VLKTASIRNRRVYVTIKTVTLVDDVLGAFEIAPRTYEVWLLPASICRRLPVHPRYEQKAVRLSLFRREGRLVGTARLRARRWTPALG